MAGREHHIARASPGVVCFEPSVERGDLDVRGQRSPHLLGQDTGSALAVECSLDGRCIERALAPMRSNVSAEDEASDGAMVGECGH